MALRQRVFDVFYNSSYWLLALVLFCLVLVTPADTIRQAISNDQLYNVFVIAGAYILTLFLALILWATRIWTSRSALATIPKSWIPVEKDDVNKNVRKMIVASLNGSAMIAWDARPRIPPPVDAAPGPEVIPDGNVADPVARPDSSTSQRGRAMWHNPEHSADLGEHIIDIPPKKPFWGEIAHKGWSSPTSPDLPNLQYTSVILELPHLIEARAVALAPTDPESNTQPPLPSMRYVELLQRPASMGLRDYIDSLLEIGVISSRPVAYEFLSAYEYARFSPRPLSELEFRNLMKLFADVLRSEQPVNPDVLDSLDLEPPESDIDDDASSKSTPRSHSPASGHHSFSVRSISDSSMLSISRSPAVSSRSRIARQRSTPTPKTPKNKNRVLSKSHSANSFSQTRIPYAGGSSSSGSSTSLSSNQESVIRLTPTNDPTELPYTLVIPGAT